MLSSLSLLSLVALAQGSVAPGAPATPTRAPLNILWLTVEDMSPWIGPYGDTTVPTPHLDAFAREAVRYDNAFASSPVCAPARTALITGMYPTRIGAMHMRTRSRSAAAGDDAYGDLPLYEAVPPSFVRCFPEHLRAAGYYTTNNSKTDYQFVAPATVWDESSGRAHYRGRPAGAPFFAVFNHVGTHESQAFPDARKRPGAVALEGVPVPPIYPDTPAVRDALQRTYNNIAAMDTWFGERLAELDAAGLAASTVVFFFSDHGVGLPRGKRSLYGTGTRVPLLVRFPPGRWPEGLAPGGHTDRVVSFVDFGPTALSLADLAPDLWSAEQLDGRAFLGPCAAPPREVAFLHADRFDAAMDRARAATDGTRLVLHNLLPEAPHLIANKYRENLPMTAELYALRDGGARAWARTPAQWQVGSTRRPPVEWYDNRADPWEVVNLVDQPLGAAERKRFEALEAALVQWVADTGDLGLIEPEAAMVRDVLWGGEGEQPATAAPTLRVGADRAPSFACATAGASIGYRPLRAQSWRGYVGGAIEVERGAAAAWATSPEGPTFEVFAHRLGYRPSEVVTLRVH